MIKRIVVLSLAISLGLSVSPTFAVTPSANSTCQIVGETASKGSTRLTCQASGTKKFWKVTAGHISSYSAKGWNGDRCSIDPYAKGLTAQIQNKLSNLGMCVGAMRLVKASLPISAPKTNLSAQTAGQKIDSCKIENSINAENSNWKGFPSSSQREGFFLKRHPSSGTIMQVIPITSSDAPEKGKSPYQDYKFYFDFIKEYFKYIDDSGSGIELRVPDTYFKFPELIAPFKISHGADGQRSNDFIQKVVSTVDEKIDFSDVDYSLVIVPAGTPSSIISQQGFPKAVSAEKSLTNLSVAQPATFTISSENSINTFFASPTMWLHEFYHPGLNLGDNHAGESLNYDSNRGIGDWGLMSNNNGDLLGWQKWLLGFLSDNQIYCVDPGKEATTNWIAPSGVKTSKPKLIVIPIGASKVLVVESIRALGLNYRLNKASLGALVYEVDSAEVRHTYGYSVMYPDNRRPKLNIYRMYDAPLKIGESLTYGGVKITNVEWGEFGDVIKVEPVK